MTMVISGESDVTIGVGKVVIRCDGTVLVFDESGIEITSKGANLKVKDGVLTLGGKVIVTGGEA